MTTVKLGFACLFLLPGLISPFEPLFEIYLSPQSKELQSVLKKISKADFEIIASEKARESRPLSGA
ncbi:MAG: hypothetical protein A2X49_10455 [Lentisphaerae bacterium GWF2_52_8]|nr:MAG: hypothetical protein A2X49_10455 [Lentisphaerae bacterium GWF2_52_8]